MFETIRLYEFKDSKKTDCYFPSEVFEDGRCDKSGLAWCFGDLMIAYAMLKYGILSQNDYYTQYSKKTVLISLNSG
jgi:hypothetical protein